MIRGLIICPNQPLSGRLQARLEEIQGVDIQRVLSVYPSELELNRCLRIHAPEAIFLSFQDPALARQIVEQIEKQAPHAQIVSIHEKFDPAILRETMRCGVREFLPDPFERDPACECMARVADRLARNPVQYDATNEVFSFIPAKAGSGASTLALNVSLALAHRTRVLLSDFDLNSGMIRFSLNLPNQHSVIDAVNHAGHMDEKLWSQLPVSRGSLDILHAGALNPHARIEPEQIRILTGFMRRMYPALCFDLSGNLEKYSLEILQESKRVFLVCTAEYASLHLAREKAEFLRRKDLGSRLQFVLNRVTKRPMLNTAQVEEVLGAPVAFAFPNNYTAVTQALGAGKAIDPGSDLGKQIARFSSTLLGSGAAPAQSEPGRTPPKRRDLFSNICVHLRPSAAK